MSTFETMPAHPVTLIVIVAAVMVTPFYIYATYVASGADRRKGATLAWVTLAFGAVMAWVCLADVPARMGMAGNLIVPVAWLTPSLVLLAGRGWFLERPLDQRWLVGLQIWRVIGACFLIEMVRGHLPGVFAYPAGIGDIAVGVLAAWLLIRHRRDRALPRAGIAAVLALGVLDFVGAFFFGFFSSETPLQIFYPATPNRVLVFPTGMIPLFLVPYAIFFHTLSLLVLLGERRGVAAPVPAA